VDVNLDHQNQKPELIPSLTNQSHSHGRMETKSPPSSKGGSPGVNTHLRVKPAITVFIQNLIPVGNIKILL